MSQFKPKQNPLTFIIIIMIISNIFSFEIVIFKYLENNNATINHTIFKNNITNEHFIYNKPIYCKSNSQRLYIENPATVTNMTIIKENNDNFPLNNITIWLNNKENITNHIKIRPQLLNQNIIELHIENICNDTSLSSHSDLQRLITISFDLNNTSYHFDYLQICTLFPNTLNHIIMLSTILMIMALMLFLATKYTLDNDLMNELKEKTNTSIDWKYGIAILFVSSIIVFLLIAIPLKSIFIYIISTGIIFILIITIYLTSASFLKSILHHQSFPITLKDIFKKETFSIKRYKIIPATLSISLIMLWLIYPNWILSNVLFFTVLFASMFLFSIPNFKTLVLLSLLFILYDLFWIVTGLYLNSIVLEEIEQPIKLIMPKFTNKDLMHPCYFISLVDIVIVCFFVKYSKCFDVVKDNVTFAYYKTSIGVFIIGGIVNVFIQVMIGHEQVFLFPLEIVLFIGGIIRAVVKNELSDFWNGENAEGMQRVVSDIVSNGFNGNNCSGLGGDNKGKGDDKPNKRYFQRVDTDDNE